MMSFINEWVCADILTTTITRFAILNKGLSMIKGVL